MLTNEKSFFSGYSLSLLSFLFLLPFLFGCQRISEWRAQKYVDEAAAILEVKEAVSDSEISRASALAEKALGVDPLNIEALEILLWIAQSSGRSENVRQVVSNLWAVLDWNPRKWEAYFGLLSAARFEGDSAILDKLGKRIGQLDAKLEGRPEEVYAKIIMLGVYGSRLDNEVSLAARAAAAPAPLGGGAGAGDSGTWAGARDFGTWGTGGADPGARGAVPAGALFSRWRRIVALRESILDVARRINEIAAANPIKDERFDSALAEFRRRIGMGNPEVQALFRHQAEVVKRFDTDPSWNAALHNYHDGFLMLQRKEFGGAEKLLKGALDLKPEFGEVHIAAAQMEIERGNTREAEARVDSGIDLLNEKGSFSLQTRRQCLSRAYFVKARILFRKIPGIPAAGEREKALGAAGRILRKSLELDPQNPQARGIAKKLEETTAPKEDLPKIPLVFPGGRKVIVELARRPGEVARGLMFRIYLPKGRGMLFEFNRERTRQFWMKNTWIDLDIIYIDKDKKIAGIFSRVPRSYPDTPEEDVMRVEGTGRYVLELPAGSASNWGLKAGQQLRF